MTTKLPYHAKEGSTFGIRVDFIEVTIENPDGVPVTPNPGLTWSLTNADGSVVNERDAEPLTPAPSLVIVLTGDDLALPDGYPTIRYLTVNGTYDSTLGSDLELKDEASFQIENLIGAP